MSDRPPRYGEFMPDRALADHLDYALPDVRIVRDHVRNPWKQRQAAELVKAMELMRDQLRTEHHT